MLEKLHHDEERVLRISGLGAEEHLADRASSNQVVRANYVLREPHRLAPPPAAVLDLGCGNGFVVRKMTRMGYEVYGCDIIPSLIRYHQEHTPEASFALCVPGEELPYEADRFDCIVCSEVIEHVYDVKGFLQELARCLKTNGVLLLTTPYHGILKLLLVTLSRNFERHFNPAGDHIRFFSPRSLADSLQEVGLHPLGFKGIGRMWKLWKSMLCAARLEG